MLVAKRLLQFFYLNFCMSIQQLFRTLVVSGFIVGSLGLGSAVHAVTPIAYLAPGLSPDLTTFNLNGVFVTPDMAFRGSSAIIVPISLPTYSPTVMLSSVTSQTFVPRNSNSAIVFSGLPTAGSVVMSGQQQTYSYSYRNPGVARTFIVQQALFSSSDQVMRSVLEENRTIQTGETAWFVKTQNFNSSLTPGNYFMRVRVYSADRSIVFDENSFNIVIQK